ncbi:hypothetical protein Pan161_06120 [Gimesia algae]|uniref:Uncharacterized protein n=1 Tax=Gimesia algae TaxID=2527971 RepID=A0A517V7N7_9PLAN|nr:hypothetical protein Pan161_06120 [Gimesia algae]
MWSPSKFKLEHHNMRGFHSKIYNSREEDICENLRICLQKMMIELSARHSENLELILTGEVQYQNRTISSHYS